jgi:hypothetical protein
MKLKSMGDMIQKLQQALQQAQLEIKFRAGVAEIKEHGAILREHIKQAGDKDEREVTRAQKQHDTETYALSAQNVAEINGLVKLLTSKTEHGNKLREMLLEFEHTSQLQDAQLTAKANQTEPEQQPAPQ